MKNEFMFSIRRSIFALALLLCGSTQIFGDELLIGTASADITPVLPVALTGQHNLRIAETIETPLTANVIALEARANNTTSDIAIMVSCDLLFIPDELLKMVRAEVKKHNPELDVMKIFINAIHTHTAPIPYDDPKFPFRYKAPEGVRPPAEYSRLFVEKVSDAIIRAWENRQPGSVTWALTHAVIGYNRRAVYADGTAVMYGNTNASNFMGFEGMEDHDVNILFFWNNNGKLIATSIDVPCTAQEVEHRSAVNADYWHPVREKLKQRFGPDLCVTGWISAAGDQSPRPLHRKAAEQRMISLRNLSNLEEITRRLVLAVDEAYETVEQDRHNNVTLIHKVEMVNLPMRIVTKKEYEFSKAETERASALIAADPKASDRNNVTLSWNQAVLDRYEQQKKNPKPTMDFEVHVIRLGDIAICTNEFELFLDYGLRMEARSNALQTFVIQLAGPGSYLPTEKAVKGGSYSAGIQSNLVGPEGGQILVDRTVELINSMFPEKK